jgi:hypothetical protein
MQASKFEGMHTRSKSRRPLVPESQEDLPAEGSGATDDPFLVPLPADGFSQEGSIRHSDDSSDEEEYELASSRGSSPDRSASSVGRPRDRPDSAVLADPALPALPTGEAPGAEAHQVDTPDGYLADLEGTPPQTAGNPNGGISLPPGASLSNPTTLEGTPLQAVAVLNAATRHQSSVSCGPPADLGGMPPQTAGNPNGANSLLPDASLRNPTTLGGMPPQAVAVLNAAIRHQGPISGGSHADLQRNRLQQTSIAPGQTEFYRRDGSYHRDPPSDHGTTSPLGPLTSPATADNGRKPPSGPLSSANSSISAAR